MKLTFALLIIIFLVFSGYHLSFRKLRLPYFARQFYLTGTEFLLLGLLLGPEFLNLLDPETQKGLAPVEALVLGWVGLIFGFQFEMTKLRRFPLEFFLAAITESVLSLILVFIALYGTLLTAWLPVPCEWTSVIAITLAAAAGCTSQTGLALLPSRLTAGHQSLVKLLRFISSIGGLAALFFFAPAFFFISSAAGVHSLSANFFGGALICPVACLGLALLFVLILSRRLNQNELILTVIGMTIVASGMASSLKFSPLITNFFVGICLVNMVRDKERIYRILMPMEKPAYLLILVFLGVGIRFDSLWIPISAFIYCGYRLIGKFISGFIITRLTPALRNLPGRFGYGLLAQGGLPLAILLDFQQAFHSHICKGVTSVAILAIVYNEFLSPYFTTRLLTGHADEKAHS